MSLSDYTKNIWNSYADRSILSVATARTYKKTAQFLQGVHVNAPMILLDGALIATMDKKIIDTKFVTKEAGDTIIEEGTKLGIYPFVLSLVDDELNEAFSYSTTLNSYQSEIIKRYVNDDHTQVFENLRAMQNNFKIVYMGDEALLRELEKNLRAVFGGGTEVYFGTRSLYGMLFFDTFA